VSETWVVSVVVVVVVVVVAVSIGELSLFFQSRCCAIFFFRQDIRIFRICPRDPLRSN